MITDPLFYFAAFLAIALVGLSKGGFLSGLGILGVPILALVISPVQAAAIMLPILISMDMVGVWAYRKSYDPTLLKLLIPASICGIAIAWMAAAYVSEGQVRLIVGLIALAFTLDHWFDLRGHRARGGAKPGKAAGFFWGAVAGFTSFVSHAGGPPISMYMLPLRLERTLFVGTNVMLFTVINLVKVLPYFLLGQFSTQNLLTTAVLLPLAPLWVMAGIYLVRLVPQEPFYRIAYACLFVVSLKLIWDGMHAFFG